MHVLITGVAGFVGSRLSRHLTNSEHRVTGTFIGQPPVLEGVELLEADLLDAARMQEVVKTAAPDAVIHLAGLSHVGESWQHPERYFRVNVLGSENLLRAARGTRVIVASSAEVYGAAPEDEQPLSEDRDPAPISPYGMTKAAMERLALVHDAMIVRSFNIVGPGQLAAFALPAFACQLRAIGSGEQPPIVRVGNLSARRDFVHVDDAVQGYRVLLERGRAGSVYNLGSARAHSIREALEELIVISGLSPQIEIDTERFRAVDVPLLLASTERLQALGWQAVKSLADALQDLWRATVAPGPSAV